MSNANETVLTDEQIDAIYKNVYGHKAIDPEMRRRTARAIEKAVLATQGAIANTSTVARRGLIDVSASRCSNITYLNETDEALVIGITPKEDFEAKIIVSNRVNSRIKMFHQGEEIGDVILPNETYELRTNGNVDVVWRESRGKRISPQVAQSIPNGDWPEDFTHENGNYQCRCSFCDRMFIGHKRRVICKACRSSQATPPTVDQPKGYEHNRAIMEAERNAGCDEYFKARTESIDAVVYHRIFEAGFQRAYELKTEDSARLDWMQDWAMVYFPNGAIGNTIRELVDNSRKIIVEESTRDE